jgi:transposase
MSRFPSDRHPASWAGMGPGNYESAGKRESGRRPRAVPTCALRWYRRRGSPVIEGTYLSAQYHRLVKRMGKKKAGVAVGRSILVIVYHALSKRPSYQELGAAYFDRLDVATQWQRLIRRLEALGLRVTVEEVEPAA